MSSSPTVFVVDDDAALRDSIQFLLEPEDLQVACFESGVAFRKCYDNKKPGCILLDVLMPDLSGLDLLEELSKDPLAPPVLLITGHGDVPMAVRALKAGAFDFIEKPFSPEMLIDCIRRALDQDARHRESQVELGSIIERYERLTARERQVFRLVVDGNPNKVIAAELGLSQKTVEVHRAHVMEKMEATSFAHLVKMSVRLDARDNSEQ